MSLNYMMSYVSYHMKKMKYFKNKKNNIVKMIIFQK